METSLQAYANIAGQDVVDHLHQLAERLKGARVVHVNSTRMGGGVAEILNKMVPFMQELDIDARWETITGDGDFFGTTKSFHNAMQGDPVEIDAARLNHYQKVNAENAKALAPVLKDADLVFIHDPQPAALIASFPRRTGRWIWRCHIDVSKPYRPVWKYLRTFAGDYDASIFSLSTFTQPLPHPIYLIPPSIDPLHEKNAEMPKREIQAVCKQFSIDTNRPLIVQVSRFDRFKDPLGVIRAYRLAKKSVPSLQLVLAGGTADDDPEGEVVLQEVRESAAGDEDIHVLALPGDAHRKINALQRAADIVLQKSIKEGFGLTVTEAMWKYKPVVGGDTGGIRIQVMNHHTGFLAGTPEGAALRIRYLLHHRDKLKEMGAKARRFVRDNFLITRHLREYLTLMLALTHGVEERIELG
jgi:trehalose synthase